MPNPQSYSRSLTGNINFRMKFVWKHNGVWCVRCACSTELHCSKENRRQTTIVGNSNAHRTVGSVKSVHFTGNLRLPTRYWSTLPLLYPLLSVLRCLSLYLQAKISMRNSSKKKNGWLNGWFKNMHTPRNNLTHNFNHYLIWFEAYMRHKPKVNWVKFAEEPIFFRNVARNLELRATENVYFPLTKYMACTWVKYAAYVEREYVEFYACCVYD